MHSYSGPVLAAPVGRKKISDFSNAPRFVPRELDSR